MKRGTFGTTSGCGKGVAGGAGEGEQRQLRLSREISLGAKGIAPTPLKGLEGRKYVALLMGDQVGRTLRRGVL